MQNAIPIRCQRQHCGARLRFSTNSFGGTIAVCDACERNRAGYCRDCARRLDRPRALRCDACVTARATAASVARMRANYADPVKRAAKLARGHTPDARARKRRQVARARAADPARAKRRRRSDYQAHREKRLADAKRRHAAWREVRLARMREHYRANRDAILAEKRADRALFRAIRAKERAA